MRWIVLAISLPVLPLDAQGARGASIPASYRATADRLIDCALADTTGFIRLAELVDTFGNRLSGSASLEAAIDWLTAKLKTDGFDNVHTEPVLVPHWVRGAESAELLEPRHMPLRMLGLGGSVGTPAEGITAPVLVVGSFDELTRRAAEAQGKIVLFDVPFTQYGETVRYRGGEGRRRGRARALGRAVLHFEPAHGRYALRLDDAPHSDGGDHGRGRGDAAPIRQSRRLGPDQARDERADAPRCAVAQRARRSGGAREAG